MRRILALLVFDTLLLGICYYLAFFIYVEAAGLGDYRNLFSLTLPLALAAGLGGLFLAGVFASGPGTSRPAVFTSIARGSLYAAGLLIAGTVFLGVSGEFPHSIYFIYIALMPAAAALTRLSWEVGERMFPPEPDPGRMGRALVVGAGKMAYEMIEQARRGGDESFEAVHIVDDNAAVQGNTMHGVKILGDVSDIPLHAWKCRAGEIVVAAEFDTEELLPVARQGFRTGLPMRVLPPSSDIDPKVPPHLQLRPLSLTDLIDRGAAGVSPGEIRGAVSGKKVLIIGADSTIGRGLCRQVARFNPAQILLFGNDPETLDVIDREILRRYPSLSRTVLLGSTANRCRTTEVMEEFRPDVVLHVAPCRTAEIAQENYRDALLGNAVAVRRVAEAAAAAGVSRFLNITSDEAGEPVNVVGLSMRMGELILQALGGGGLETGFSSVRVGEVIDEETGLAHLWLRQAERGGPVTVSHEDAERRYISSDRAALLVLQAAAFAKGGEIFAAGPGKAMQTVNLVRLAAVMVGHGEGKNLEIRYRGLARGERLKPGGSGNIVFAETGREGLQVSQAAAVADDFLAVLSDLEDLVGICDSPREIFALARQLVPEYQPQGRKHI